MVGQYIIMFAKKAHLQRINGLKKFKIACGLQGMAGNKGATSIRFNFDDTSFAFMNVHMESGQTKIAERLENVRTIYNETF